MDGERPEKHGEAEARTPECAPVATAVRCEASSLVRSGRTADRAIEAGRRIILLAAHLPDDGWVKVGWDASRSRRVRLIIEARGLAPRDVEWALEGVATLRRRASPLATPATGYLHAVDAVPQASAPRPAGFGSSLGALSTPSAVPFWSTGTVVSARDLTEALLDARATISTTLRSSNPTERTELASALEATARPGAEGAPSDGAWGAVGATTHIITPGTTVPLRLRALLSSALPHASLRSIGDLAQASTRALLDTPLLNARALPAAAAQALLLVPGTGGHVAVGISTVEAEASRLPVQHTRPRGAGLTLGTARTPSGRSVPVVLPIADARLHTELVGQTGTGKSTILATIAVSGIDEDLGVTVFDPHGTLCTRIAGLVSARRANRVNLVRLADTENPVRANLWGDGSAAHIDQVISGLTELLVEMFDPHTQGIVGPRFERWFGLMARANWAFLGHDASLETIASMVRSPAGVNALAKAIRDTDPETAHALEGEYGRLRDAEFAELLSWTAAKFERFASNAALRQVFGSPRDSLSWAERIERRDTTLVDLGFASMGTGPARIAGTLLLQQLWQVLCARGHTEDDKLTHLVIIDEAHLFQYGPLPRMLAEGRKFGVAIVLAHQHMGQLSADLADAASGTIGSLVTLRSSPRDAALLAGRLGTDLLGDLPRLPQLTGIASLSVGGSPTAPFTLTGRHPKPAADAPGAEAIEAGTHTRLVDPFRNATPLPPRKALERLRRAAADQPGGDLAA